MIQDEKAQGYEQLRKAAKVPELLILCELPLEVIRPTLQNTGTHFLEEAGLCNQAGNLSMENGEGERQKAKG